MSSTGANPDKSTELRIALANSVLDELPDELITRILGTLPSYAFGGPNVANCICRLFNQKIKALPKALRNFSEENILKSCSSAKDALIILRDKELCKKLSLGGFWAILDFLPLIKKELFIGNKLHETSELNIALVDINIATHFIQKQTEKKLKVEYIQFLSAYHPSLNLEMFNISLYESSNYSTKSYGPSTIPLLGKTNIYDVVIKIIEQMPPDENHASSSTKYKKH